MEKLGERAREGVREKGRGRERGERVGETVVLIESCYIARTHNPPASGPSGATTGVPQHRGA